VPTPGDQLRKTVSGKTVYLGIAGFELPSSRGKATT